jgi:RND family efflux transporter MFP subunit
MTQLTEQQRREVETQISEPRLSRPSHASRAAAVALLVLVVAGGFSVARRFSEKRALAVETEKLAVPVVSVIKPSTEPAHDELVLPAQLQAYVESPIYARTNGYLLHWYKDIGARVKKGEILAEIDTPEIDQELSQAKATREQIQAQMDMAKISADRWTNLRKTDSVSQQEADQQTNAYTQARANLAAANANVRRLEEMESFKRVYAPFAGVITRRNTDIGALINAGQTPGNALFRVADTHRLRIYVSVPQSYAGEIHSGLTADLVFADRPGKRYQAAVVSTARALDASSRTLQVELQIDNGGGELLPGSYAQVHFDLRGASAALRIPVNAVLFRAQGLLVATVDSTSHAHLHPIVQGRDFGQEIEVLSGVAPEDTLIVNPPDSISDGMLVRIAAPAAGAAPPGHT